MFDPPSPEAILRTDRFVPAAPHEVFAAFANPEVLARWWGPAGFTNSFERFEFRPEGRWVFTMHGPNGGSYPNESVFREIVPDAKVVLDHVVAPLFRLTATLNPEGEGTRVTWEQAFATAELAEKMRPLSIPANEQNLDRLAATFATPNRII